MEMLLYLFSNFCCNLAGMMLLYHCWFKNRSNGTPQSTSRTLWGNDGQQVEKKEKIMISKDLQIMLCIGNIARVYWSSSPPQVWSTEPFWIQILCIFDVYASPFLWIAIVSLVALKQQQIVETPIWCKWYVWAVVAFVLGYIGSHDERISGDEGWPLDGVIILFNMLLDGFAMVPQLHLISSREHKTSKEASHFVGLLCLGRVLRMLFWGMLYVIHLMAGSGGYIWTFVVPDVIHTVIMADYLYVWLKKVKHDTIDPYLQDNMHV